MPFLKPLSVHGVVHFRWSTQPHTPPQYSAVLLEPCLQLLAEEVGFCSVSRGCSRNFTAKRLRACLWAGGELFSSLSLCNICLLAVSICVIWGTLKGKVYINLIILIIQLGKQISEVHVVTKEQNVKIKYKLVKARCKSQATIQGKEESFNGDIQNAVNHRSRQHGNKGAWCLVSKREKYDLSEKK